MVGKNAKKEELSPKRESRRSYRKSPARIEAPKSPSKSTIKSVTPSSRPALRKSPSRTVQKSTVPKSPTRSPSRRSPSRKSPNRLVKDDTSVPEKPKRLSRSQRPIIDIESGSEDSETDILSKLTSEKPKATVTGRARKLISEASLSKISIPLLREITPTPPILESHVGVTRRSVSKSHSKEIDHIDRLKHESLLSIQKLTELSDEDEVKSAVKEKSERRSMSRLMEGKQVVIESGWLVPLLLIGILPLVPIVYYMLCNEVQCHFTKSPNLSRFKHWSTYFDVMSFMISFGFGLLIILTSAIPYGGFKISGLPNKQGKLDYVMNGMSVAICVLTALIILEFYNIPIIDNIISKHFQLLILINGMLLYKDIEIGKGKESAFDLKLIKYNPTLLVAAITQLIYLVDFLVFETAFVTTSTAQYEAVGYQTSQFFTYGLLLMCVGPKYIYDYKFQLPLWHLTLVLVLFSFGYFLYRASNSQKHAFRQNPYNPSISHLETLATSQGKKLLVSGYWGWVRHPNYLGDIIMNLSFALCVYNSFPVIIYILDILFLLQRAQEDGVKCKLRYGSAWERYCQRVKHVLIPKIY
ncbi:hypothetical protein FQR65_LT05615 [Abscondita terminalis]|nr:hypothetical protein FQR65_LT05615 [Abscondita terminalis]